MQTKLTRGNYALSLASGWAIILLISLTLYDGLLYDGLRREIRGQTVSLASMSASTLNMKISTGLRLGKNLRRFMGLDRLLDKAARDLPAASGLAVFLPDGELVSSLGGGGIMKISGAGAAEDGASGRVAASETRVEEKAGRLNLILPIKRTDGEIAGYTAVSLPSSGFAETAFQLLRRILLPQAVLAAAALALLFLPLFLGLFSLPARRKRLPSLCLGLFLLTMGVNAFHSLRIYLDYYTLASRSLALSTGRALSEDLNKLFLVGASLGNMGNMDQYLRNMSENTPDQSVILNLLDPRGRVTVSSHLPGTEPARELSSRLPLLLPADSPGLSSGQAWKSSLQDSAFQGWGVLVGHSREAYREGLRTLVMNVLTLVVISLMLMVESFFLVFHYTGAGAEKSGSGPEQAALPLSPLLRALLFLAVLGVDMSISFIPLRMEEFSGSGAMHPALMGMPVSVEILLAGCGIFIAGIWTKRRGLVPPMTCGFCLTALGCLASMLASGPLQFILARALAGAGYGLIILPPQAGAVKEGKLAFIFAGVYAGSLCGSSLGAMLADSLGYARVFGVSSLILLALAILPFLLFGRGPGRRKAAPPQEPSSAKPEGATQWRQIRALAADPSFLALALFSLLPGSFLSVGLLNFLLPVFLHDAGVPQADIGRVFLLYCLIVIYAGPRIENIWSAPRHKPLLVFMGGAAGAAAIGGFALLPPTAASVCAAVFLGLATGCNLPGQSSCMLRLRLAGRLGEEVSMGILNTLERLGQMLGPLCVGILLATLGAQRLALRAGIATGLAGLAFLLYSLWIQPALEAKRAPAATKET
ncbi:MAG: MFS transporter [Deltaproteobacteria bacterium]|jgi:MFS family permease|nr:MFS transporter [Deltaproteobacteria bacterium]